MENEKIRLNKYIASSGCCSRRKADELIKAGSVIVNGQKVIEPGFLVSSKDKVVIQNRLIKPKAHVYIRYYKPAGYITTMDDEKDRRTIYDALPDEVQNLKPAGRLDKDSSGLLILTNDGDFINELMHPSVKVPKVYRVIAEGKVTRSNLAAMEKGIEIEKGKTAYAYASIIDFEDGNTIMEIVLYQGLNRQIRKMLEILEHPVIALKRLSIGPVDLQGLKRGQFKYIKPKQVQEIKNYLKKLKKDAQH